jgi:hypothetical protein
MHYVTSTVPLHFAQPVSKLAIIDSEFAQKLVEHTKQVTK